MRTELEPNYDTAVTQCRHTWNPIEDTFDAQVGHNWHSIMINLIFKRYVRAVQEVLPTMAAVVPMWRQNQGGGFAACVHLEHRLRKRQGNDEQPNAGLEAIPTKPLSEVVAAANVDLKDWYQLFDQAEHACGKRGRKYFKSAETLEVKFD